MYRYFFKMALRNLLRTKGHSLLNIFGLVAGIIAFLTITIHVYSEFNYDSFNRNFDRIYRCCTYAKFGDREGKEADSNGPLANAIINDLPGTESVLKLCFRQNEIASNKTISFIEHNIMFADSNFFEFFDYKLMVGDKEKVLKNPNTVVLTQDAAKKYFGDEDPIGKTLVICDEKMPCEVTGIMKNAPKNSHLQFDMIASYQTIEPYRYPNWGNWDGTYTYLTVKPNADLKVFKEQFPKFQRKYYSRAIKDFMGFTLEDFEARGNFVTPYLQPLREIHTTANLDDDLNNTANARLLIMLAITGILILLVACVNFTNLSTARASNRAKEIGIKKVSGSMRGKITFQLLAESFIQTLLAVVLALVIFVILLPVINRYTGFKIEISDLQTPLIILLLIALPFILGVFAGAYPAFYLSAFKSVQILNGAKSQQGIGKTWIRGTLVSFQFFTFMVLIISAIFINKQVQFVKNHPKGYNHQNLVVINNTNLLNNDKAYFKDEILKNPRVVSASYSDFFDRGGNPFGNVDSDKNFLMQRLSTDKDFAKTLDIKIVAGRFFNETDKNNNYLAVVSESAAKLLGGNDLVGKYIMDYSGKIKRKVIGVFKDFQRYSFKIKQAPLVIIPNEAYGDLILRVSTQNSQQTLKEIKKTWEGMNSTIAYDYSFLDDRLNKSYSNDEQIVAVLTSACILAIIIACFGLLGLVTYSANARQKEIGIRKVNGAKEFEIIQLLNGEYMRWVIISFVLSCPISWIIIRKWLEGYTVKTAMSWWIFILTGSAALIIAIATVSWISFKASRQNPIEALRYE